MWHILFVIKANALVTPGGRTEFCCLVVSALLASGIIKKGVNTNNFSAKFLLQYDKELHKKIGAERKLSHYLQILSRKPRLFNFVVSKASRSKELRETISCMFENVDIRKKFMNPLFYLRILFNR